MSIGELEILWTGDMWVEIERRHMMQDGRNESRRSKVRSPNGTRNYEACLGYWSSRARETDERSIE
jgi:hypothetical protein